MNPFFPPPSFQAAHSSTANLRRVIKFTGSNPRCTPSCAFSRRGRRGLFRRRSHSRQSQRVSPLWPSHPLCTRSPTDVFRDIDWFLCSLSLSLSLSSCSCLHPSYSNVFTCLCAHSDSVKRDTWWGRGGVLFPAASLPFRRPDACSLTPAWSVDTGSDGTQGSRMSPAGVMGWGQGGRWGSDRVWEKLLCYASPDTRFFASSSHSPVDLPFTLAPARTLN